jgi:hypothetical protein
MVPLWQNLVFAHDLLTLLDFTIVHKFLLQVSCVFELKRLKDDLVIGVKHELQAFMVVLCEVA